MELIQNNIKMLDSAPYVSLLWNSDFEPIACNSEAYRLFGLQSKEEFLSLFFNLMPCYQPDGRRSKDVVYEYLTQAKNIGYYEVEWLSQKLNGEQIPCEIILIRLNNELGFYISAYMRDLREVKNLENTILARNEEIVNTNRLLAVINDIANILLLSDESDFDQTILTVLSKVGKAVNAQRSYIWKDKIGSDGRLYTDQVYEWIEDIDSIQPELSADISYDDFMPSWQKSFKQAQCINCLLKDMSPKEQIQFAPQAIVSLLISPICIGNKIWGFIGFDDCINERIWTQSEENFSKNAGILVATSIHKHQNNLEIIQARLLAEEATKAKSDFLARMSHEIRTPMNAILGLSYLCLQTNLNEKQNDYLLKVQNSAKSLLGLLNDILDFSKIESQHLTIENIAFSLTDLIAKVEDMFILKIQETNLTISYFVDPALNMMLLGDPLRINQILVNLISNSIKFTNQGNIYVEVKKLSQDEDKLEVQFSVQDTGIGLSQEEISQLFMPFSQSDVSITRKYGGTGLGLAICKQLTEIMGGSIQVSSKQGMGSNFNFKLALKMAKQDIIINTSNVQNFTEDLKCKKILLVEDNEINQIIACSFLDTMDINYVVANNGKEAVHLCHIQDFDLILMDIQMPIMDGLEATKQIFRLKAENTPPIIAMTAHAMDTDKEKSLAAGMVDHIVKPLDPDYFFSTIIKYLNKRDA